MLNLAQMQSIIRAFLLFAGSSLVTLGVTTDSVVSDVSGALLVLVPVVWSFFYHAEPK